MPLFAHLPRPRIVVCWLVECLLLAGFANAEERPLAYGNRWAVILASDRRVETDLGSAPGSERRSRRLAEVLAASGYQSVLLLERDATRRRIEEELGRLSRRVQHQDVVICFLFLPSVRTKVGDQFVPFDGRIDEPWTLLDAQLFEHFLLAAEPAYLLIVSRGCASPTRRDLPYGELRLCGGEPPAQRALEEDFINAMAGGADRDGDGNLWLPELLEYVEGDIGPIQGQFSGRTENLQLTGSTELVLPAHLLAKTRQGVAREKTQAIADLTQFVRSVPANRREPLTLQLQEQLLSFVTNVGEDAAVRIRSVQGLVELESASAIPALGETLENMGGELFVLSSILDAMIRIDPDRARPHLFRLIRAAPRSGPPGETQASLKIDAIRALVTRPRPDDVEFLESLFEVVEGDQPVNVRLTALQVLPALSPNAEQAGRRLLRFAASEEDTRLVAEAINSIGSVGEVSAVPFLIEVLHAGRNEEVRTASAYALGRLVNSENRSQIEQALVRVLDEKGPIQEAATYSLGQVASETTDLLNSLGNEDPQIRASAARSLGELGERARAAVPNLIQRLEHDQDSRVRYACAQALGRISGPDTISALLRAADRDGSASVRRVAVDALGAIETGPHNPALVEALGNDSAVIRGQAVEKLARTGDPAVAHRLIPLLADEEPEIRELVVRNLARFGDQGSLRLLVETLEQEDPRSRQGAARLIGYWVSSVPGQAELLKESLMQHLEDRSVDVRREVLRSLGQFTDRSITERLLSAVRNEGEGQWALEGLASQIARLFLENQPDAAAEIAATVRKAYSFSYTARESGSGPNWGEWLAQIGQYSVRRTLKGRLSVVLERPRGGAVEGPLATGQQVSVMLSSGFADYLEGVLLGPEGRAEPLYLGRSVGPGQQVVGITTSLPGNRLWGYEILILSTRTGIVPPIVYQIRHDPQSSDPVEKKAALR